MGSSELHYTLLLFTLFVFPRLLMRFGIPAGITSLLFGAIAGIGFGWFGGDPTIRLLATFGIISLFLFAGLDVDFQEIRQNLKVISQHVVIGLVLLAFFIWAAGRVFSLNLQAACILSLALLTPSAGFILDSINSFRVSEQEKFWIKSKAISTELVALAAMFIFLQSDQLAGLAVSSVVLVALVAVVPVLFRFFAMRIAPFAPDSEFAFLLMIAIVFGMVTRKLGAYYLVGAFIVGMAAHRYQKLLPGLVSATMVHSIKVFASFFIPFYFFQAGLDLSADDLSWRALATGIALLAVVPPLRVLVTSLHRMLALGESFKKSLPVGLSLLPTLVFGLVLAAILRERFHVPNHLFGGLVIYTLLNTVIPAVLLRTPAVKARENVPSTALEV